MIRIVFCCQGMDNSVHRIKAGKERKEKVNQRGRVTLNPADLGPDPDPHPDIIQSNLCPSLNSIYHFLNSPYYFLHLLYPLPSLPLSTNQRFKLHVINFQTLSLCEETMTEIEDNKKNPSHPSNSIDIFLVPLC